MAGTARIGQFTVIGTPYGAPVGIAKPADNVTTAPVTTGSPPTASPGTVTLDSLYAQLKTLATPK